MNIVTPYPTSIPINTVNVTTELARRDSQLREMITKPSATEAGVAERGVASEHDKSKQTQQQQGDFDVKLSQAESHQKIGERKGGQGEQGAEQDQKDKEKEQAAKQAAAEQKLAKVEKENQRLETQEVRQLQARDTEVRTHEQAHAAVGGRYAGSPTYEFKRGPDGRNYAVGGEVQIDVSPVPGDPKATIDKMQQVRAAALAPAEPSGQDRKVAAQANQTMSQARADQIQRQADEAKANAEQTAQQAQEPVESETAEAEAVAQSSQSAPTASAQAPNAAATSDDPFSILFGDSADQSIQSGQDVGQVFGAAGAPGGERRDEVNANRAAAEQRNADVVARAGRIESFYAQSTVPREGGFSQFA